MVRYKVLIIEKINKFDLIILSSVPERPVIMYRFNTIYVIMLFVNVFY